MNAILQTQKALTPSFSPASQSFLQRISSGMLREADRRRFRQLIQYYPEKENEINDVPPIVNEVLNSAGQPLDSDTRNFMESHFGHDFKQHQIYSPFRSEMSKQLIVNPPGDIYDQEADQVAKQVMQIESQQWENVNFPSVDFSLVQVHTGAKPAKACSELSAKAFTLGKDIVFGAGQYAPRMKEGQLLLAHELTHVIQQSMNPATRIRLKAQSAKSKVEEKSLTPTFKAKATSSPIEPYNLTKLQKENPEIAKNVIALSYNYHLILQEVGPILTEEGIYKRKNLAFVVGFENLNRVGFLSFEDQIILKNHFDAKNLSIWVQKLVSALENLSALIDALMDATAREFWEEEINTLLADAKDFKKTEFIKYGIQQREAPIKKAKLEEAVNYIRNYISFFYNKREKALRDSDLDVGAYAIANKLFGLLDADQIAEVFYLLQETEPELYEKALFKGKTIWQLHELGISGLQAFKAKEEGLISGILRGEKESLLAKKPGQRTFKGWEVPMAVGGFIAGLFKGIGDSIISNVKAIIELLSITFWKSIAEFVTKILPEFIDNEDFRFEIGIMIGQASAEEERSLATAPPFEYGLTIGTIFGYAITETVLTFIGLGWILKGLSGSTKLAKISRFLAELANRIAKSAIATKLISKGISMTRVISESINAFLRRLAQIRSHLPAITSYGKMEKALDELSDIERKVNRTKDFLSTGAQEDALNEMEIISKRFDDFDTKYAKVKSEITKTGKTTPEGKEFGKYVTKELPGRSLDIKGRKEMEIVDFVFLGENSKIASIATGNEKYLWDKFLQLFGGSSKVTTGTRGTAYLLNGEKVKLTGTKWEIIIKRLYKEGILTESIPYKEFMRRSLLICPSDEAIKLRSYIPSRIINPASGAHEWWKGGDLMELWARNLKKKGLTDNQIMTELLTKVIPMW